MKKTFSVALTILFLVSLVVVVPSFSVESSGQERLTVTQIKALAEEQRPAIEAHETLYNSFFSSENGTENYPENYGGDYIDGTKLHVCIVNLKNQDLSSYVAVLSEHLDNVVFEDVQYSLQTLLDAKVHIAMELGNKSIDIVSVGVSEPNNALVVQIEPEVIQSAQFIPQTMALSRTNTISEGAETMLYKLAGMTFPVPTFFEECSPMVPAVELMGGSALDGYTLGVCGTYNGRPAIATCGHGLSLNTDVYYQVDGVKDQKIGKVNKMRYADNSSGDYSIITITNSSFTTTNMVGDPTIPASQTEITGTISRPATGTVITKYGKNAAYAYGVVTSSNTNWYPTQEINNVLVTYTVSGMVNARISIGSVVLGDSGGPVYTSDGYFCGTTAGTATPDDYGFTHFVFSPYYYLSEAGFTALTS